MISLFGFLLAVTTVVHANCHSNASLSEWRGMDITLCTQRNIQTRRNAHIATLWAIFWRVYMTIEQKNTYINELWGADYDFWSDFFWALKTSIDPYDLPNNLTQAQRDRIMYIRGLAAAY